jgi:hypothetical protein
MKSKGYINHVSSQLSTKGKKKKQIAFFWFLSWVQLLLFMIIP